MSRQKTASPPKNENSTVSSDEEDLLGGSEAGDTTPETQASPDDTPDSQLPGESLIPWKPAGINGGANNFQPGDAIIIALELWSPTSQQFWKIVEVTYAENNVFTDAEDNAYPWHRIEAWVEKDLILPNIDQLRR